MTDITKAKSIEGWMTEFELLWLAERAVEHRVIVEVGSYLGRSTRALLDHTLGVVYAIDDWKGPRDVYMEKRERELLYGKFLHNVHEYIASPKLVIVVCDHRKLTMSPESVDMVFLDGSHTYEDIKADIVFWKSRMTKGLLCGHDIQMTEVQMATDEVLGDVEVAPDTTIWFKEI